jgi:hypothetical protein
MMPGYFRSLSWEDPLIWFSVLMSSILDAMFHERFDKWFSGDGL